MTGHSEVQESARPVQDEPPFGDFWEGSVLYIDGRLTRNQARHIACGETGGWYKRTTAHRVWMRPVFGEEALELSDGEFPEFFAVCGRNEPGAAAMWKVKVA